jgi:hypothetical protein
MPETITAISRHMAGLLSKSPLAYLETL